MDGNALQAFINAGLGQAANLIGLPYTIYRSTTGLNPIVSGNIVGNVNASFNVGGSYNKPNKYASALWQMLADGTLLKNGDYFVNGANTYFLAARQLNLPLLAVECNRTITIKRPHQPTGAGDVGYSGDIPANDTAIMQGCPASILQGTKGEKSPTNLPGDDRLPWFVVLLPYLGNVVLKTADIISDDLGRRYVISSAELTDLGWRMSVGQVGA